MSAIYDSNYQIVQKLAMENKLSAQQYKEMVAIFKKEGENEVIEDKMKSDIVAHGVIQTIKTQQKEEQKNAPRPLTAVELGGQNKKL